MNKRELLQQWLELKNVENKAKEERVSLEEQIFIEYGDDCIVNGKSSGTITEGEFKLTIKMNSKLKVPQEDLIPEGVDVWKTIVDDKKLSQYANENWVETVVNKPTFTVVKVK